MDSRCKFCNLPRLPECEASDEYEGGVNTCSQWRNQTAKRLRAESCARQWPVPDRFKAARIDSEATTAFEAAKAWYEAADGSPLLLMGDNGSGKTWLGAAILNQARADGLRAAFVDVTDLLVEIRASYSRDSDTSEAVILDTLEKEADIILLDDFGAEKPSEHAHATLFKLINGRYAANLPMIVTTNKSGGDMGGLGLKRIWSRLHDGSTVIKMQGNRRRIREVIG